MNISNLSSHFIGIAAKRLSAVEANPEISNQHELNGVAALKSIFGEDKLENLPAKFFYLDDDRDNIKNDHGFLTWYDSRENQTHRSAEYRLYYSASGITDQFREGDLVIVGKKTDGTVIFIVAKNLTTTASQLAWLFDLGEENLDKFKYKDIKQERPKLGFAANMILDELGIEAAADDSLLDLILNKFGPGFPPTAQFSEFARFSLKDKVDLGDPDNTLMAWMEHEERLFRTLEKFLVSKQLKSELGENANDVDAFIEFSLSVQNRRKARVGAALENHLEHLFKALDIRHSRGKITENKSKPDFIFPSIEDYRTSTFPAERLTMLGAKTTCKDRWRQVLSEAKRISEKHLLTLEPSISEAQTTEMKENHLSLVVPKSFHETYTQSQRGWLMSLSEFIKLVRSRDS